MTHTEVFNYYDWTVHAQVDSLISPGRTQQVVINFKCPRCDARNKPLEHGEAINCVGCGLDLCLLGNGLHATINVEEDK